VRPVAPQVVHVGLDGQEAVCGGRARLQAEAITGLTFPASRIVVVSMSGFDSFGAELQAFSDAIGQIERDIPLKLERVKDLGANLTHAAFAHRARSNFVAAGLVSLVEYRLYDLARARDPQLELSKVRTWPELLTWLSKRGIEVGQADSLKAFEDLRLIRNAIVHGFGDITLTTKEIQAREAIQSLQFGEILVGGRRICFTTTALRVALQLVRGLMNEIEAQDKQANRDMAAKDPCIRL
jgi:hypothetical protein